MNKPPSFQFYPADWYTHTRHLDAKAYKVFVDLLCLMWLHGEDCASFPFDTARIAKMIGMSEKDIESAIAELTDPCFSLLSVDGNLITSKRLGEERAKQKKYSETRSKNAEARWGKDARAMHMQSTCNAHAMHTVCSSSSTSSSTSSSLTTPPLPPKGERVKRTEKSSGNTEIDAVFDAWNAMAEKHGLPKAYKDTKAYRSALNERMKESEFRNQWRQAIEAVPANPWNMGENTSGWRANFKWFLGVGQTTKILNRKQATKLDSANTDHTDLYRRAAKGGPAFVE